MKNKNGLIRLLGTGALLFGISGKTLGDRIESLPLPTNNNGVTTSIIKLYHSSGATEGWDPIKDSNFLQAPSPTINYYSLTTIPGHDKLQYDVRGLTSLTTYNCPIVGVDLTNPVNANLNNTIITSDHAFDAQDIFLKPLQRRQIKIINI
jgi:hypothetical protein